ncbi:MAG: hypothetical protein ACOYVF_09445 [Candidatus Zixiibacteriota bacterium]
MRIILISLGLWGLFFLVGCDDKAPSRDHIPVIKQAFSKLETAVKDRNRAALDSLMSVRMLENDQNSDSLLSFIFGPDGSFAFERFGDYEIFYTNEKARIDCFLMDSTGNRGRPAVFTMILDGEQWLLKRFEPGVTDTLPENTDTTDIVP